jgi:hypothetical protein
MSFAAPLKENENMTGQHSQADPSSTTGQTAFDGVSVAQIGTGKIETHPSRANRSL